MDKYKIVKTEDGKWLVLTRDYFWQRWKPYKVPANLPSEHDTVEDALRSIGLAWWKEFTIRVDSIGVF